MLSDIRKRRRAVPARAFILGEAKTSDNEAASTFTESHSDSSEYPWPVSPKKSSQVCSRISNVASSVPATRSRPKSR
ncbi:protein of unknown function [Caballeronia sp. S22]